MKQKRIKWKNGTASNSLVNKLIINTFFKINYKHKQWTNETPTFAKMCMTIENVKRMVKISCKNFSGYYVDK